MTAQVPTLATKNHTVFASTYETTQGLWTASKDYKVLNPLTNLTEALSNKILSQTSKLTGVESLEELDRNIKPRLVQADSIVSPYVEKANVLASDVDVKLKPVIAIVRSVPGVGLSINTASVVVETVYGYAIKNFERVSEAMLLENPEKNVPLVEQ